jgi:hypothetical protein
MQRNIEKLCGIFPFQRKQEREKKKMTKRFEAENEKKLHNMKQFFSSSCGPLDSTQWREKERVVGKT